MSKKVISKRKRLAAVFASFAILIIGTVSLFESMSLDYYSVLNTMGKIIPASIALGGLGWIMGMILDSSKKKVRAGNHNNLFLNEIVKNNLADVSISNNENIEKIDSQ